MISLWISAIVTALRVPLRSRVYAVDAALGCHVAVMSLGPDAACYLLFQLPPLRTSRGLRSATVLCSGFVQ